MFAILQRLAMQSAEANFVAPSAAAGAVLREEIREWEKIGFDVKISGRYDVDDGTEFEAGSYLGVNHQRTLHKSQSCAYRTYIEVPDETHGT
jgi:hypothetical protein